MKRLVLIVLASFATAACSPSPRDSAAREMFCQSLARPPRDGDPIAIAKAESEKDASRLAAQLTIGPDDATKLLNGAAEDFENGKFDCEAGKIISR